MYSSNVVLLIAAASCVAILLAVAAVRYLLSYAKALRYVKAHLARATDWRSMVHWKRELSALRWSFIPGLTPKRVKAVRRFFYRGKYARRAEMDDGLSTMLIPAILSIFLCITCLAGGTFAWFTATQTVPAQTITAANFSVEVTVTAPNGMPVLPDANGTYTLGTGAYAITLKAEGTATKGYCIIDLAPATAAAGEGTPLPEKKYAGPLMKGESYTFTVESVQDDTKMMITPCWGSHEQATIPTNPTAEPAIPPETTAPGTEAPE